MNRIISVGEKGWSYEADQRHGELIVEMLGLDGANPVGTREKRRTTTSPARRKKYRPADK